jgi:hypothetical protein
VDLSNRLRCRLTVGACSSVWLRVHHTSQGLRMQTAQGARPCLKHWRSQGHELA